ncbi:MAG: hypothetical protein ACKVP3_20420 [Hyphomicrobiaceae bacterium]
MVRVEQHSGRAGAGWATLGGRLAVLAVVALLGGCADALPSMQMPDLIRDPRKLMSPEEQKEAIDDLSKKKAAQEAEAARQAEVARQAEKPKN